MFVVPSLIGGVLEKQQNQFSEKISEFTVSLKDILSGFEIIKSYSMKKYIIHRFDKSNEDTINAKYSVCLLYTSYSTPYLHRSASLPDILIRNVFFNPHIL